MEMEIQMLLNKYKHIEHKQIEIVRVIVKS